MRADDRDALLGVFADPRVMDAFASPPFTPADMTRWIARNLAHQAQHGYGLFTVELRESGLVIGDCGIEHMDIGAELGYDLRSDQWGRGYATEAATAVRDLAFGPLALPRLVSLVRTGNTASRRVAEKVGMTLREETVRHGVRYWLLEMLNPRPSA
jgi:RimJ/RimL family protein N-acetyltransferase